jgi:hypothetical protein
MAKQQDRQLQVIKLPARKLSVSISGRSGQRLDTYCQDEDRSPSWTLNALIERYLDKLPRGK